MRFKADLPPVSKAKIHAGSLARRLRHHRLETAPVSDDLIEPLAASLGGRILLDDAPPVVGSLGILTTILVDLRNLLERLRAVSGARLVGDLNAIAADASVGDIDGATRVLRDIARRLEDRE